MVSLKNKSSPKNFAININEIYHRPKITKPTQNNSINILLEANGMSWSQATSFTRKITACVVAILVYSWFPTDQVVVLKVAADRLKSL